MQIGIAALVFTIFTGLFAIGAMGGGDVKLLGAMALWLHWLTIAQMLDHHVDRWRNAHVC